MTATPITVWFSLRRRLLALLLGGVAAAWVVTMALSYADAHHEVDQLFDAQLAQVGQTLLALAGVEGATAPDSSGALAHKYQRHLRFQIWHADGRLLMRSANAPETPLTTVDGFSEVQDDHGHWRYFRQWNASRSLQVQVAEDHYIRDDLIEHIAWRLLLPALFGLPLIGFWVWLATRQGLSPLNDIARQIAARAPQQLQPVTPPKAPEEIRALLDALNALFDRVAVAMHSERRFTADAAHELRTPLAALQAQLQVAQRAQEPAERERALAQLQLGLSRAGHLVDQMLLLARLDPESGLPDPQLVDLAELAERVCADFGALILERNPDFELETAPGCIVTGQAEWLQVLIRNLLDNAIHHGRPQGRIRMRVAPTDSGIVLAVCDDGPGIPPTQREAALRRFHRLAPGKGKGSGLGLAIVARIAELHGALLTLDDGDHGQGLCARVTWPTA